MHRIILFSIIALMLLGLTAPGARAGRLYARKPDTASPLYNLRVASVRTTVTIRNLLAVTHVDEEFVNDQAIELEGFYVFQLPEGAVVDGLWLWENNLRYHFIVKRTEDAKHIYDSLSHNHFGAPAILQSFGANRFELRVFPIRPGERRRIELQYFQLLPMNQLGRAQYYYPLNLKGYQDEPVERLDVRVRLDCSNRLDSVTSNFDARPTVATWTDTDSAHAVLTLQTENFDGKDDLVIRLHPHGWSEGFPFLSYADKDTVADGYFIAWTPIPMPQVPDVRVDFTFVLDASASMTGLRSAAVRNTMRSVLTHLQPYDRFRIVLFSDSAVSCPPDTAMHFADEDGLRAADTFFDAVYQPRGGTNYEAALSCALLRAARDDAEQRILFLTDGLPNLGARTADSLARMILNGGRPARFFPITLFTENLTLLYDIARSTSGKLVTIGQEDSIPTVIDRLSFDFTQQSYTSPILDTPPSVYLTYPPRYPANATSEELVCTGRFVGSGPVPFRLTYFLEKQLMDMTHDLRLQPDTGEPVEVARYWAAQRIKQLLLDLKSVQDSTEIRETIIRLSEKFNILSPFTSFLIVTTPDNVEGVADARVVTPATCDLLPGYPNPFTMSTTISFRVNEHALRDGGRVTVTVYDERGALVRVLADGVYLPGLHQLDWDARDAAGLRVPAGRYFCVLRSGGTVRVTSLIVIR